MEPRPHAITVAILVGLLCATLVFAQTRDCSFKVIDHGEFRSSGDLNRVQVIPKELDLDCLISYASKLTREHPGVRYRFYDDQSNNLDKYIGMMRLLESGNEENILRPNIEYTYSDKWLHKHHIATLWARSDVDANDAADKDGCQSWLLKAEDGRTMATFD